ncbi:MAG: PIN domain-containing protein [Nitrososphaerota archaeon]|nr:PIN domain-containing protein [Nitrososphaerota archaeon]MDG6956748.1 PIN domain-containing protein [Nitrososphaerota archaeon]MDG6959398.1 PIN domain-containing protein [Nitrososphaerota archaeon]MDG6961601.1 PIN domain-containing protein [Nitrososphaerota archaeon]MDG6976967.1 PIN domain-containing protein [Nitrososphaerota archaeon]
MKGSSFDTRFLIELFYAGGTDTKEKVRRALLESKPNYLSTAALSEIYKLTLEKEGKDVAELRANSLAKDFRLVSVDKEVAIQAALIKHKHGIPFADSLIASTARILKIPCYTDDPHFRGIEGVTLKWIS